ncbi:peptidylprolyl isomerase [bacterium]|nr:peptidylprolyl isomerase [bacterium]
MTNLANKGVLAIYNDGEINEDDIRWYIQHPPQNDSSILRALELTPEDVEGLDREQPDWLEQELAQALLKRIIQHIALIKSLTSNQAKPDPNVSQAVQDYKKSLMMKQMESELDRITPTITRQEMLTYYVQHPEEFYEPGDRLARHIMLSENSADAEISVATIEQKLKSGEDFQSLLKYSESETANSDGYIGWVEEGTTAKPFEKALWALDIHEVTGPIQVGDTWHFIQLIDKHEQGLLSFDQCQPQIQIRLIEEKSRQHRLKLLGITNQDSMNAEERYSKALLKAAYEKGYDKDESIIKKVHAFEMYHSADMRFNKKVQQRMKFHNDEEDSTWIIESETVKSLLKKAGFKMVVELSPTKPSPVDEVFMDSPANEN